MDDIWIDRDDSEQWNWDSWDDYWRNYDAADEAPETFMYHKEDPTSEEFKHDEDLVCQQGAYLNEQNTCMPCPAGCEHCLSLGHCYSCTRNFEAVSGPDFGFCFPKCFHGMYRQTVFTDKNDLLRQLKVPEEEIEADADMKLVVPPHLMMQTCKHCDDNCRGCFSGLDGEQFCYECMHGFIFDKTEGKCVVDPSWSTTESEIKVIASKRYINECDQIKVRMNAEAGFDPVGGLQEIQWNIHISNMDIDEKLSFMLQKITQDAYGKQEFVLSHEFTQQLEVGAQVKIAGYAAGRDGGTVTDAETIEVNHEPEYELSI